MTGLGTDCVSQTRPIHQAAQQLAEGLDRLEVTANTLFGTFGDVLTPEDCGEPEVATETASPAPISAVASSMYETCHRVNNVDRRLRELINRCELG
jgi:hypothetical protein